MTMLGPLPMSLKNAMWANQILTEGMQMVAPKLDVKDQRSLWLLPLISIIRLGKAVMCRYCYPDRYGTCSCCTPQMKVDQCPADALGMTQGQGIVDASKPSAETNGRWHALGNPWSVGKLAAISPICCWSPIWKVINLNWWMYNGEALLG